MGREHKYRAYSEIKGKMLYWPDTTNMTFWKDGKLVYFDHDGGRLCLSLSEEMQYTGYKSIPNPDIIEIYEGDIFQLDDGYVEQVTFQNGCWYLGDERLDEFNTTDGVKYCRHVGNIHENPDLII
jgi:hypothetical protein